VRERLFEAFFTTKPTGQGTGLGLSISRRIATSHGGSLTCDSRPGRTVFRLELPSARDAVTDPGPARPPSATGVRHGLRNDSGLRA